MAIETVRYYAGWADKLTGDTLPVSGNFFTYTLREPVGVVGAIVPWNFPLNLATWKVAPALAVGCTVVLKPAHETPLTALMLGELAVAAGLPAGALNVVPGPGATAGAALVRHRLVDKIAFTGTTRSSSSSPSGPRSSPPATRSTRTPGLAPSCRNASRRRSSPTSPPGRRRVRGWSQAASRPR